MRGADLVLHAAPVLAEVALLGLADDDSAPAPRPHSSPSLKADTEKASNHHHALQVGEVISFCIFQVEKSAVRVKEEELDRS